MPIERYCTEKGCSGGANCTNKYRREGHPCPFEYVRNDVDTTYNWLGEEPPPSRWVAADGTHVYRCYADYVDD